MSTWCPEVGAQEDWSELKMDGNQLEVLMLVLIEEPTSAVSSHRRRFGLIVH